MPAPITTTSAPSRDHLRRTSGSGKASSVTKKADVVVIGAAGCTLAHRLAEDVAGQPRRPARPAARQHRRRPARRHGHRQPLVRLRLHAGDPHHEAAVDGRRHGSRAVRPRPARSASSSRPARAICWTYEVTNVSQNPTQTVERRPRDHVADRRQRHAGEPGRRLPPGLRRRRHERQRPARRRRDRGIFTSQGVAGRDEHGARRHRRQHRHRPGALRHDRRPRLRQRHDRRRHRRQPRHRQRRPAIRIKKAINAVNPLAPTPAEEADSPTGPVLAVGSAITWTYRVHEHELDAADDHADHRRQRHAEQRRRRLHARLRQRRREPERQARPGRGLALQRDRHRGARPVHEHRRRPGRHRRRTRRSRPPTPRTTSARPASGS